MDKQEKIKIVIKNNFSTPIILEGVNFSESDSTVILPSDINSQNLGVIPEENGYCYPLWFNELQKKASLKQRVYLVISEINNIEPEEQLKFYEILKYRTISGVKLPTNAQILLTSKKDGKDLNPIIASLSISYKVE